MKNEMFIFRNYPTCRLILTVIRSNMISVYFHIYILVNTNPRNLINLICEKETDLSLNFSNLQFKTPFSFFFLYFFLNLLICLELEPWGQTMFLFCLLIYSYNLKQYLENSFISLKMLQWVNFETRIYAARLARESLQKCAKIKHQAFVGI